METLKNVQTSCVSKVVKMRDIVGQEMKKLEAEDGQTNVSRLF